MKHQWFSKKQKKGEGHLLERDFEGMASERRAIKKRDILGKSRIKEPCFFRFFN